MTERLYLEDLHVGQRFASAPHHLDAAQIKKFAAEFDPQPFHLDDAAAAANPLFGRLCASGWHTAAMGMRMTADYWETLGGRAILGGAGIDELRWLKPVYPGDTLRCECDVIDARPSASKPHLGIVRFRLVILNQDDVPVLSQISNVVVRRRPQPASE